MFLYVVCTAGEFVWNKGGDLQLPAPYITICDFVIHALLYLQMCMCIFFVGKNPIIGSLLVYKLNICSSSNIYCSAKPNILLAKI